MKINFYFYFLKMAKNPPNECKHIIKDNYYCINCGTICYNKVRKNKFLINIHSNISNLRQGILNILIIVKFLQKLFYQEC